MSQNDLLLRNKQRLLVPLICLPIVVVAFAPIFLLIDFNDVDPTKLTLGIASFILLFIWLATIAWRAPFEATFGQVLTVRKLLRSHNYDRAQIRRWRFLHPEGAPSQNLPAENGLIQIDLIDGTSFRAEVDRTQAQRAARWLYDEG